MIIINIIMKKFVFIILLLVMLTCCRTYHKIDFIVDNYGIEYLDSIHRTSSAIKLRYPADAFRIAKPYLKKRYGKKYNKYKPYRIEIVDDSLWAVWPNPNFRYFLTARGHFRFCGEGIGISMYDSEIKLYKYVKQ